MESFKHNPEDSGGVTDRILSTQERLERYCAVRGCASGGFTQIGNPKYRAAEPEGMPGSDPVATYRLMCRKHVVEFTLLLDAFFGDPSPLSEAQHMADWIGLDFSMLVDEAGARPGGADGLGLFNPIWARCVRCGGAFIGETAGMFSGTRYVHTCGVTSREHAEELLRNKGVESG